MPFVFNNHEKVIKENLTNFLKSHNFCLDKRYSLANQKLLLSTISCYVQIYKILDKKTWNNLENGFFKTIIF